MPLWFSFLSTCHALIHEIQFAHVTVGFYSRERRIERTHRMRVEIVANQSDSTDNYGLSHRTAEFHSAFCCNAIRPGFLFRLLEQKPA